jgi:hypothetical protein
MFFCDPCMNKNKWPNSLSKSHGNCEVCGNSARCNDVPSKYLPMPMPAPKPVYKAKHRKAD